MPAETRRTFTIGELEKASGFDRRTIAYYIQAQLLPKVGRRGPKTGYPSAFLDRLMFIRAVRDLQDAGTLRAVTLDEIREVMGTLDAATIVRLIGDDTPDATAMRALFVDPDWNTSGLAVAVEQIVGDGEEEAVLDAEDELRRIATLLRALSEASRRGERTHSKHPAASTAVRRLDVLPNVSVDVRHLPEQAVPLLDELGVRLARLQNR